MGKLYNEETKEKFLSTYENEQTQTTIRNVFFKTELVESVLEKDLYDFTVEELGKAIENTNPHTANVARSNGRFLSQYISWAIESRLRKNALNPLKGVVPDWYDRFIDKNKKIHYSFKEFIDLLEQIDNGQDQAFLFMIWEGVMGERFSQLQELTYDDVNKDNKTVYIKERDTHISVSDECIKYIEKAYNEKTYYQYNKNTKEFVEKDLLPSNYIFKNVKSPRATEGQMVGMGVFYNRLHIMKEQLDLEYLTPMAIKQSGMIYEAIKQYEKDNVLAYDQLAEVGKKYDYSTILNQNTGEPYFNTYLMKEFVNENNIKELYDIDLEIKLR
jgi:integrase